MLRVYRKDIGASENVSSFCNLVAQCCGPGGRYIEGGNLNKTGLLAAIGCKAGAEVRALRNVFECVFSEVIPVRTSQGP